MGNIGVGVGVQPWLGFGGEGCRGQGMFTTSAVSALLIVHLSASNGVVSNSASVVGFECPVGVVCSHNGLKSLAGK